MRYSFILLSLLVVGLITIPSITRALSDTKTLQCVIHTAIQL